MTEASQTFSLQQRWYNSSEPELGVGSVVAVEGRDVTIFFAAREVTRQYAAESAPLVRALLSPGARARRRDGGAFVVESVETRGPLLSYHGKGQTLREEDMADTLELGQPLNRLKSGQFDADPLLFDLRLKAHRARHRALSSPWRGFLGGRIELYPHQLYVAHEVCARHRARVLLTDEVGLGKTIEAALVIHRFLLTRRVERVLILVPPGLVHQWFAELYLRFHVSFRIVNEAYLTAQEAVQITPELLDQRIICPLDRSEQIPLAEADWDLVVVDEAHQVEPGSANFALLEKLAQSVEHMLLLTATPEQAGEEGHFQRLALLDPGRFRSYDAYQQEKQGYLEVADLAQRLKGSKPLNKADKTRLKGLFEHENITGLLRRSSKDRDARRQLLGKLLDQHGLGRLMFRNVRAVVGGFPRRQAVFHRLSGNAKRIRRELLHELGRDPSFRLGRLEKDSRVSWLVALLTELTPAKVLLICNSPAKTLVLAKALGAAGILQLATFHEQMSLMERDRMAAWFQEEDGPQLMLSSPIGAEGRNFQFARHLVLFDLPLDPEQVEQRIGRLDRIGQGAEIFIHLPFVPDTPQHRLVRWFDEALGVFRTAWHGSRQVVREFGHALLEACCSPHASGFEELLQHAAQRNREIIAELETGRDRLLEYNSFDEPAAQAISLAVQSIDEAPELEEFMLLALDHGGIDCEEVARRTWYLQPNETYARPFPGFRAEGMVVSFDRSKALGSDSIELLSWDHPMVRDALESTSNDERGNACVAKLRGMPPGLVLEGLFVVECSLPERLRGDRFFPPTPLRFAVDLHGAAVELPDQQVETTDAAMMLANPQVLAGLERMLGRMRRRAEDQLPGLVEKARQAMRSELAPACARLEALQLVNPSVTQQEIELARKELAVLSEGLGQTQLRLDALRLLVCMP